MRKHQAAVRRNAEPEGRSSSTRGPDGEFVLPGFRIVERLQHSVRASIYRAMRESDGRPVVLKVLLDRAITSENIGLYRHEYELLKSLHSSSVITVYDFKQNHDSVALVLEDFGAISLKQVQETRAAELDVGKKIDIAVKLVAALRDVHSAQIIHKDVTPNNVVVNLESGELKLIDFGLATLLPVEHAATAIPTLLQGTLAYLAPEQTGRMNRAVDYRSDFYSLGATLYELFTEKQPFTGNDALEVIHAHIARQPTPPHHVRSDVPETISAIILKLLAKTAEERYQSVWSLEADLEECLRQWRATGSVSPFPIDRLQVSDRFRLPQKLYGRDTDLKMLLTAFDLASTGRPEVLFVTGPSGIGKTSLVREVYKPITAKRGYFASGKFDQFQRNVPYSAVAAALRELIRQILSESEEQVAQWKSRFQEALGANGRVLTEILPELELIIGAQPEVAVLGPIETHERLGILMRKFFAVVCQPEHPFALYLDDLQWADGASLGLLQQILCDPDLRYLLLIAAYRDNEVDAAHPLMLTREKLKKEGIAVSDVRLTPHAPHHIERLIIDALSASHDEAAALAKLVHEKTGGNPFFVEEFLKSLHAKNLLRFDGGQRCWQWDLDVIRNEAATDNVIDLLAHNIRELPAQAQQFLQLAACLGGEFDTRILGLAADRSMDEATAGLHEAVVRGFLRPADGTYHAPHVGDAEQTAARFRFTHDRVHQAVYHMLSDEQRAHTHYRIGRLLLSNASLEEAARDRFQIVNHLNAGRAEASAPERIELAKLNLIAGRQAKATAVHEAALTYFRTGISLLGDGSWTEHYDLMLALQTEAGQVAPHTGEFEKLDACLDAIKRNARTALEKMPIYEAKIEAENRRADFRAAGQFGLEALDLLGAPLPRQPRAAHVMLYMVRMRFAMIGRTPENLVDQPRMTEPLRIAEARILRLLSHVFYFSNRTYLAITLFRQLYLCARHGHCETSPSVYASYGMQLCAAQKIEEGYRFGQLALALLDRLDAKAQRPYVTLIALTTLRHWKNHCRTSLPIALDIYRDSLDMGAMETATMALLNCGYTAFHAGELLPSLHTTLLGYIQTQKKLVNDTKDRGILELYRDACAYLMGLDEPNECFPPNGEPDKKTEKKHPFTYHFLKTFMAVHCGDAQTAYRSAQSLRKHLYTVIGVLRFADLYDGLAHAMIHPTLPKGAQKRNRESIERIKRRLQLFAKHAPANYEHRWLLLEAECAQLDRKHPVAERYYDQAIGAAKNSGHLHEEALANEIAARYYISQKKPRVAQAYMQEARALYVRWGARRKVQWLDETYPQFRLASVDLADSLDATATNVTNAALNLDLPALMKALKTIAEENVHSQILKKTIDIVMQFAGAEKALLLLRDSEDKLRIEADMDMTRSEPELLKGAPVETSARLSQAVVNYAKRTKASVVIHDAQEPQSVIPGLPNDQYLKDNRVKSILCIPVTVGDAELIGLLYVENNQSTHTFTERRVETLEIICLSVAGRLELSRKAIMDSLTGLYNRAYFQSALRKELALARRKQRPVSLVMIDIDHFKRVNDTYGHQMGDAVLQYVARTLKESCRESDVVARYGGEEMAVILTETSPEQALEVAERIRQSLAAQPFVKGERQIAVTASLGIATNTPERQEPESMIKAADEALYRSKEDGRNRVTAA